MKIGAHYSKAFDPYLDQYCKPQNVASLFLKDSAEYYITVILLKRKVIGAIETLIIF